MTAATEPSREVVERGLHPSRAKGTIWGRLDEVQRRMLRDSLRRVPVEVDSDHAHGNHEPGRLPYVCSRCAVDAVLVMLEGERDA